MGKKRIEPFNFDFREIEKENIKNGTLNTQVLIHNGDPIMPICIICKEDVPSSEGVKTPDGFMCAPCCLKTPYEDEPKKLKKDADESETPITFTCAKCKRSVTEVPNDSTIGDICDRCADRLQFNCELCGKYIIGKKVELDEGSEEWYCKECIDKGLIVCPECEEYHPKAEFKDFNGKSVCADCFDLLTEDQSEPDPPDSE